MNLFWENAHKLLEAAIAAAAGHNATHTMTVVIGAEGGIHLIPANDWPLDRLAEDRGARMAYRVTQGDGHVSLDGVAGKETCRFEADAPANAARRLLKDRPQYLVAE